MRPHSDGIPVTEREVLGMTAELDAMHHETLPRMYEAVAEWAELRQEAAGHETPKLGRRGFLAGSGLALGGALLAACGSSSGSPGVKATPIATNDLKIAALAISLENLAIATYQSGITAAASGRLGAVPPAFVTFAKTAHTQHRDHAEAWNAILQSAGRPPVTGVDSTVKAAVVDPAFAKVTDVAGLAKLSLVLEDVAAATYLDSIGLLKDSGGIKTAASIHPVELQHAAILNFVLGRYPVPRDFATVEGARGLTDKIA